MPPRPMGSCSSYRSPITSSIRLPMLGSAPHDVVESERPQTYYRALWHLVLLVPGGLWAVACLRCSRAESHPSDVMPNLSRLIGCVKHGLTNIPTIRPYTLFGALAQRYRSLPVSPH